MVNSRHYYKGQRIEEPVRWQELEVRIEYDKAKIDATINFDSLEFKGQTAIDIIADLNQNGYYEGREYRIEVGEVGNPALTFHGSLNANDNPVFKACNIIELTLNKKQGVDWLVGSAEGVVFRYLASSDYTGRGSISDNDHTLVPYIINFIPDGPQLLLLSLAIFGMTKELVQTVQSVANGVTDLVNAAIPVTGVAGIIPVVAYDVGDVVAAIINLGIQTAYSIGITIALVKLTEDVIEQIAPVKRYHKGIRLRLLVQRSCEYLGLTLKSDLLDSLDVAGAQWTIIPSKGHKGGSPPTATDQGGWIETGVPSGKDGFDNFGQLINFIKDTFNAEYKLKDGVFEIERKDFLQATSSYIIPNTFTNQDDLRNEYTLNTTEIRANTLIVWAEDPQDQNTIDNPDGRLFQAIITPTVVQNPDLVNLKGLKTISIPFSMAVRKDKLTVIEEILKVFLQAADFFTGGSFAAQFSARIGSMHLSSHFLTRPKMVVMSGNGLAMNQRTIMGAQRLWNDYHYIGSFVTIDGSNNQQWIYEEQKIPFCFRDFVSLENSSFCRNENGERVQITSIVWKVKDNSALISYRIFRVYDTNLKIEFIR